MLFLQCSGVEAGYINRHPEAGDMPSFHYTVNYSFTGSWRLMINTLLYRNAHRYPTHIRFMTALHYASFMGPD